MKSYVLRRGACWLCLPPGVSQDQRRSWCPGVEWSTDSSRAWEAATIDVAIERQTLARALHGWNSMIQAKHD